MAKKAAAKTAKKKSSGAKRAQPKATAAPKRTSATRAAPADVDPITAALQRRRQAMLSR